MRSLHLTLPAIALILLATSTATGQPRDAATVANQLDAVIDKTLIDGNHAIAPAADDAEFVRRAYLDLHGVIPTPEAVLAFLNNSDADKRAKLIDELLAGFRATASTSPATGTTASCRRRSWPGGS